MAGATPDCFQDVAFLPSRACLRTTFVDNCGGGGDPFTATCLRTVIGGRHVHAPFKIYALLQILFLCQIFVRSQGSHRDEENLATISFRDSTQCKTDMSYLSHLRDVLSFKKLHLRYKLFFWLRSFQVPLLC